jgi:hypothetical protein
LNPAARARHCTLAAIRVSKFIDLFVMIVVNVFVRAAGL